MKKVIAFGIVFLFVMISFTSISGQISNQIVKTSDKSIILYVGGNGPGNYSRIQDAIDNASDGDTVFVFDDSSPYYENIIINKSISLVGEDRNNTVIDGGGNGDVVTVTADWLNISGFTIRNCSNYDHGIIIDSTNNNTIKGNTISDNAIGIYQVLSINNTISDNHISSNIFWGIGLDIGANYNTISGNIISDNSIGLFLHHSNNNKITGNYIISNRDYGINLNFLCNKSTISNNNYDKRDYSKGDNIIYNNYFYNNNNAWDDGENIWNITKTSGTNIVGGPWLGGNFWSSYIGEDLDGDGLGDTELPHKEQIKNGGDWLPLKIHSPSKPIINGPTHGRVGKPYDYTFMSVDYKFDNLSYYIIWGDGKISETVGPSGENVTVSHTWTSQGIYTIKAKAENPFDESRWATFTVTMPRNKAVKSNMLLLRILEKLPLLESMYYLFRM